MKNLFTTIITLTSLLFIYSPSHAQIKVTPSGDFAIGQNYTSSGFKTEINGERKIALGLTTRHEEGWGWASISDAINPYTKHWIVSQNGYNTAHNFYVYTTGDVYTASSIRAKGDVTAKGKVRAKSFFSLSDASIKENIQPINNSSELIDALNPVYYDYIELYASHEEEEEETLPQIGFIAQEIQEILPQLIDKDDSTGLLRVNYQGIIPLLVKHAQEQNERIELLEEALTQCCEVNMQPMVEPNDDANLLNSEENGDYLHLENQMDNPQSSSLQIVPNPNRGSFDMKSNLPITPEQVLITNLNGQFISNVSKHQASENHVHIDFTDHNSGVYYVHLLQQGKIKQTQKIVVLN